MKKEQKCVFSEKCWTCMFCSEEYKVAVFYFGYLVSELRFWSWTDAQTHVTGAVGAELSRSVKSQRWRAEDHFWRWRVQLWSETTPVNNDETAETAERFRGDFLSPQLPPSCQHLELQRPDGPTNEDVHTPEFGLMVQIRESSVLVHFAAVHHLYGGFSNSRHVAFKCIKGVKKAPKTTSF